MVSNAALRDYVQDRLSGLIATPDGIAFDGPVVVWKGRRAVYRQSRRWSSAWSPEQIAQRLKVDFPEDTTMRISHEAIYQALYIQGRGALKRELSACLRSGRALRLPRERARKRGRPFLTDALMISDRPAEVGDRAVPGQWEGDLILGLGIRVQRWLNMYNSKSKQGWKSTFATLKALGNAEAMKIPMACYASTFQRAQILAGMALTSCAPSRMP